MATIVTHIDEEVAEQIAAFFHEPMIFEEWTSEDGTVTLTPINTTRDEGDIILRIVDRTGSVDE